MTVDYALIGKRIREKRVTKQMTQAWLAELTGMSVSYISYIERAKKQASLGALIRISRALQVTVDDLLAGNQHYDLSSLSSDWAALLSDCSDDEKGVIYDTACALKTSLRRRNRMSAPPICGAMAMHRE